MKSSAILALAFLLCGSAAQAEPTAAPNAGLKIGTLHATREVNHQVFLSLNTQRPTLPQWGNGKSSEATGQRESTLRGRGQLLHP